MDSHLRRCFYTFVLRLPAIISIDKPQWKRRASRKVRRTLLDGSGKVQEAGTRRKDSSLPAADPRGIRGAEGLKKKWVG